MWGGALQHGSAAEFVDDRSQGVAGPEADFNKRPGSAPNWTGRQMPLANRQSDLRPVDTGPPERAAAGKAAAAVARADMGVNG